MHQHQVRQRRRVPARVAHRPERVGGPHQVVVRGVRFAPGQLSRAQAQLGEGVPGPVGAGAVSTRHLQVLHRVVELPQVEQGQAEVHPRLGVAPPPPLVDREGERGRRTLRVVPASTQHPQLVVRPSGDLRTVISGRGGQHGAADLLPLVEPLGVRQPSTQRHGQPEPPPTDPAGQCLLRAGRHPHHRQQQLLVQVEPAVRVVVQRQRPLPVPRGAEHRQVGHVPFGPAGQVPGQPGLRGDPGPDRIRVPQVQSGAAGQQGPDLVPVAGRADHERRRGQPVEQCGHQLGVPSGQRGDGGPVHRGGNQRHQPVQPSGLAGQHPVRDVPFGDQAGRR
ncbi:hypothetical protein PSN01_04122 [Micromonospora saelicesensis]|nr:hypothetical protein PSN01_04122 [Micromonospora saelicesensis]